MSNEHRSTWGRRSQSVLTFLERRLGSLTSASVWRVLALGMACIAAADYLLQPYGVHLGPLYILPACLASWRFNLRVGLGVVAVGMVVSVIICVRLLGHLPPAPNLGNLALHILILVMTAGIVSSLRRSYDRERLLACRDGLTGALNKLAFERHAESMMMTAASKRQPLLLAFLDLDGFKSINDRYGHEAGDRMLQRFATEGRAILRREDCFGRIGGDEFAILTALPSITAAYEAAETLHARLTRALGGSAQEVTCSMGALAVAPSSDVSLTVLLREVDRLMYAAKHGGKDGVRFSAATPTLEPELPLFADRADISPVWSRPILSGEGVLANDERAA